MGAGLTQVKDMLRRDFPWVVVTLLLMFFVFLLANRAMDEEKACHSLYHDFVVSCYEAVGVLPVGPGFNYSWDLENTEGNLTWFIGGVPS